MHLFAMMTAQCYGFVSLLAFFLLEINLCLCRIIKFKLLKNRLRFLCNFHLKTLQPVANHWFVFVWSGRNLSHVSKYFLLVKHIMKRKLPSKAFCLNIMTFKHFWANIIFHIHLPWENTARISVLELNDSFQLFTYRREGQLFIVTSVQQRPTYLASKMWEKSGRSVDLQRIMCSKMPFGTMKNITLWPREAVMLFRKPWESKFPISYSCAVSIKPASFLLTFVSFGFYLIYFTCMFILLAYRHVEKRV